MEAFSAAQQQEEGVEDEARWSYVPRHAEVLNEKHKSSQAARNHY